MKKILLVIIITFVSIASNAAINVVCDIIYKNSKGEWSDFLRYPITLCLGHEINEVLESRTVFAIIKTPDNERIILKMKGFHVQTQELNTFNTFLLLTTNDMINRGIDFELYDDKIKQDWKIYPKDEIGLLIDPSLSKSESGKSYNEGTLENRNKGFRYDRVKPKNDPKHTGDLGEILYSDQWLFYIVKVNDNYIVLERNDFSYRKAEIGDTIVGDFSVSEKRKVFYNKTNDVEGLMFNVIKVFNNFDDSKKFVLSKWPY